jgi:hypothetical protein
MSEEKTKRRRVPIVESTVCSSSLSIRSIIQRMPNDILQFIQTFLTFAILEQVPVYDDKNGYLLVNNHSSRQASSKYRGIKGLNVCRDWVKAFRIGFKHTKDWRRAPTLLFSLLDFRHDCSDKSSPLKESNGPLMIGTAHEERCDSEIYQTLKQVLSNHITKNPNTVSRIITLDIRHDQFRLTAEISMLFQSFVHLRELWITHDVSQDGKEVDDWARMAFNRGKNNMPPITIYRETRSYHLYPNPITYNVQKFQPQKCLVAHHDHTECYGWYYPTMECMRHNACRYIITNNRGTCETFTCKKCEFQYHTLCQPHLPGNSMLGYECKICPYDLL